MSDFLNAMADVLAQKLAETGYVCRGCGERFDTPRAGREHCRAEHGGDFSLLGEASERDSASQEDGGE